MFKKSVADIINENRSFFDQLNSIREIFILGHSLNNIDLSYFELISKKVTQEAVWNVSFYNNNEKLSHKRTLLDIGILETKVNFIKIFDLI